MIGGNGEQGGDPGIMYNTMNEIFALLESKENGEGDCKAYAVRVSFLEIYNETIRDLIMPKSEILDLREDPLRGIVVAGLSEIEVETADEILQLLMYGNKNRTQEATMANQASSRSHAVLQITCEHTESSGDGFKS